jgi:hypothetical protein
MRRFAATPAAARSTTLMRSHLAVKLLALSCVVVFLSFSWQAHKGFSLSDEGYLWYGAQRVTMGEIPIRDFLAYDPGRYYWSAAWMSVVGNSGIISLRASVAVFQALGLFAGLLLIASELGDFAVENVAFFILSAAILLIWMYPRHKLFDISSSIFLIGILAALVRNPTAVRYFAAGMGVGLIAVFGRNHGIYGAIGSVGVMLWVSLRRTIGPAFPPGLALFGAGLVVGFAPILIAAIFAPGFAAAFWESILFLFEFKATNLPLPVPWPWTINYSALPLSDAIGVGLVGAFFVAIPVFVLSSLAWCFICRLQGRPVPPAFVAASFLALPYAHFAYSRADIGHLAQGIFSLLIGCLVLLATAPLAAKWPLGLALLAASALTMHAVQPGWQCNARVSCENVDISGSTLALSSETAKDVALIRTLAAKYAAHGETFIATPLWPGAYALLERTSPMWESYALVPRAPAFERREIERIKAANPTFAIVVDQPLDGREELRYRNTHPLTYRYIVDNFDRVADSPDPSYEIYKTRERDR